MKCAQQQRYKGCLHVAMHVKLAKVAIQLAHQS